MRNVLLTVAFHSSNPSVNHRMFQILQFSYSCSDIRNNFAAENTRTEKDYLIDVVIRICFFSFHVWKGESLNFLLVCAFSVAIHQSSRLSDPSLHG